MKTVFNFDVKVREQTLGVIRHLARRAAELRLAGQIARAKVREDTLDQLTMLAEIDGYGDEAVDAERDGQRLAQRRAA
jgi:hypothetical protein